jgi:hypothetical protein
MRSSPMEFRLIQVEKWRKARCDRLLDRARNGGDPGKAMHAAELCSDVTARLDRLAISSVASYSDRD